ncbi:ribonuclease III [Stenoxybacter acetivorans]|uniref:ribonuclease III n=1 Tax=Stenoxybacter acetivorans TaxID=422441 RepID=UPI000691530E|nr:ribonuclease III [Stenoxybacter acetivorans]
MIDLPPLPALNPRHKAALARIQQQLQYTFRQPELLRQALTHRSFSARNYERLEFIGDAILDYGIAKMLCQAFPTLSEGDLSRMRASLVNQEMLAEIAAELNIGDGLFLGTGELRSGGTQRSSILADALEAIFAAISFDTDIHDAEATINRLFAKRVHALDPKLSGKDAKTQLQEFLQARRMELPKYRIIGETGKSHEQQLRVECDLGELARCFESEGRSRREAEQDAAAQALVWLKENYPSLADYKVSKRR